MLFNEFAQWAVLMLLGVFVYGLIRQLGHLMIPRRDHLLYLGPEMGKELPTSLLDGLPAQRLKEQIHRSHTGLGLLAVVNDRCNGCQGLVAQLEMRGLPIDGPVIALVDTTDHEYATRLERLFTYVIRDEGGKRSQDVGIIATPFVLALDGELKVKHRGISGGLHELIEEWTGARAPENGRPAHDHQRALPSDVR